MATQAVATQAAIDADSNRDALANIAQADLIFYRNLLLQITLTQQHMTGILNLAREAAGSRGGTGSGTPEDALKALQESLDQQSKLAEEALGAAPAEDASAPASPSEAESARVNLVNVVQNTRTLMQNAVATNHSLDVLGQAALARAVSLILSKAAASSST